MEGIMTIDGQFFVTWRRITVQVSRVLLESCVARELYSEREQLLL